MSYYNPPPLQFTDGVPTLYYQPSQKPIDHKSSKKSTQNNTFIDWYAETNHISAQPSYVSSRKWLTLALTAIISGYIVTLINLTSVWINDLRKGLCVGKLDEWSLLNPYSTCPVEDWKDWSEILFLSNRFVASALVNFPVYLVTGLFTAFLAVYVSQKNLYIQQSGIPEIKEIVQGFSYDLDGYLGIRTLAYKILGLSLVVASGFWLGKEGPYVHVSCCILNVLFNMVFSKQNRNEAVRRELLSAASATGIALAFNSPIGGVLFVLEAIPSYFFPAKIMWNSFVSSTLGLVVLIGFKVFTEGLNFKEEDLFLVEFGNFSWLVLEFIPFIGLGIAGGVFGYCFIRVYNKVSISRPAIQTKLCLVLKVLAEKGHYVEILAIFFATCLLNFPVAVTRMPLDAFLKSLFTNCPVDLDEEKTNSANFMCSSSSAVSSIKLLYIGLQAFFLSSYTFGTVLPGGVLMPSLVIGAVFGRFVGILSQSIQTHLFGFWDTCTNNSCNVSPASYAVIGAGAFMTGITKLTMCVVVILFELSGALSYVLPIMTAVMVLKFVSDYMCNENIYDSLLKYHFNTADSSNVNVSYNEGKGNGLCNYSTCTPMIKNKLPEVPVSSVMASVSKVRCLYLVPEEPMTVNELHLFLNEDNHEGYPLAASPSNPVCLGYLHKQKILDRISSVDATADSIISFQVANTHSDVLSLQIRYEQSLDENRLTKVEIEPEKPFIIMNDQTWLSIVIDAFEKMYLNYLIITDSRAQNTNVMAGFIDRFMISRIIDQQFASLLDELVNEEYFEQFDIEADTLPLVQRERDSIELIT